LNFHAIIYGLHQYFGRKRARRKIGGGHMIARKLLEKGVLIRLTERGFVETVRYFGLPEKSAFYETAESEFARVPVRREENRQGIDTPRD
jgi:hypothetical protein